MGVIQRTMRFQSFDTLTGMTGWTSQIFWTRSLGPMPKFQVGWIGTLMRLATGFCAAFLNSSALAAAAGVSCVATEVPAGLIGVSCAGFSSVATSFVSLAGSEGSGSAGVASVAATSFSCPAEAEDSGAAGSVLEAEPGGVKIT